MTSGAKPSIKSWEECGRYFLAVKIDAVLARHYGLTDEELDYIINYDIKYRTSQN